MILDGFVSVAANDERAEHKPQRGSSQADVEEVVGFPGLVVVVFVSGIGGLEIQVGILPK